MKSKIHSSCVEETEEFQPQADTQKIRHECLRLLTRREHSRKEIEVKLAAKGFVKSQVSAVLDELIKSNWQDDLRYAESYTRVRRQKGFGPVHIAYELKQQGIASETINTVVWSDVESWREVLHRVYAKKYPCSVSGNNDQVRRIRFLLQRGFDSTMIQDFFKNALKN